MCILCLRVVVLGHLGAFFDHVEDVLAKQRKVSKELHPDAELVENVTMLGQLAELGHCHVHERINLVFRPLEVLDAERIDGDTPDTRLEA